MLAGFFYVHGFIFNEPLKYFTIAWSLEIEFWFCLLSPILAFVVQSFSQKNKNATIIIVIICGICADHFGERNGTNLVYYLHFFGAGMYIANNLSINYLKSMTQYRITILTICLFSIFFMDLRNGQVFNNSIGVLLMMMILFIVVNLKHNSFPNWSILVGLFSYSIYLLLAPVIGFSKLIINGNSSISLTCYFIIMLLIILMLSAVYFLLFEKILVKWLNFHFGKFQRE